jgi:hypothetical protein
MKYFSSSTFITVSVFQSVSSALIFMVKPSIALLLKRSLFLGFSKVERFFLDALALTILRCMRLNSLPWVPCVLLRFLQVIIPYTVETPINKQFCALSSDLSHDGIYCKAWHDIVL